MSTSTYVHTYAHMYVCDNLQHSMVAKFLQVGDVPLGTTCFNINAVHTFLLHAFLSLPGPPYFFLSLQYLHTPQSFFLHPSHLPHLVRTCLSPTFNITVSSYYIYPVMCILLCNTRNGTVHMYTYVHTYICKY